MSSLMNNILVFQQTTNFVQNDFAILDDQGSRSVVRILVAALSGGCSSDHVS